MLALFAWTSRWKRRQADVRARQIALTDAIHERLGAVVAPLVRRGRRGWQVHIAVSFEHRATMDAVLAVVREVFAPRMGEAGALKIVLTGRSHRTRRATAVITRSCRHANEGVHVRGVGLLR